MTTETPDAAEIAAIREVLDAIDRQKNSRQRSYGIWGYPAEVAFHRDAEKLTRRLLAAVEALEATCESRQRINDQLIIERQEFIVENAKLRTANEVQAARIAALESENGWLKSHLSPHDGNEYDVIYNRSSEGE